MLVEETLFGTVNKVAESVQFLKDYEPPEGYYLAFSGGKDSICIKELANMAGVKYDAHYNVTTIDPPELVRYIRQYHQDVKWEHPEKPFLKMLPERGFPQRMRRWCCAEYKECGGSGRRVILGIRAAESTKRAGRRAIETCYRDAARIFFSPIISWSDDEVWEFIRERNLPYCELYDQGFHRIGCMFCPMAGKQRQVAVERYPRYVAAFIKAFEELYANRKAANNPSVDRWSSGEEMFWWWVQEDRESEQPDQTVLFE